MSGSRLDVTADEKAAAEVLESQLRPHIVKAWHTTTHRRKTHAVIAGYFDHAAELLEVPSMSRPNAIGVGIYSRSDVLNALLRSGNDELVEPFLCCADEAIPVMLCAGTHVLMVYLHPVPAGAATVGRGGDA